MRLVSITRTAAIALAAGVLILIATPRTGTAQETDIGPLANLSADKAFSYFSGRLQPLHNHPAIFADSARGKLVVTGLGVHKEFAISKSADALKAYRNLLYARAYEPDGIKRKSKLKDQELLAEFMSGMTDSAKSLFTSEQLERFNNLAPTIGYDYFSGNTNEYPNHPVMYAHGRGFTIEAQGMKKEFEMNDASKAFAEYVALLESARMAGKGGEG